MNRALWPHQERAIALLRQSLGSGHRRPMLMAPTGAGKTIIAGAIVDGAMRKGKRVTFVVPALSLINQTVERFVEEGLTDIGVIQANHPMTDWTKPIQVASIQTLQNRDLPRSDVVVFDEAHRLYERHKSWLADPAWAAIPFVGLSATPWASGLGKYFDDLLISARTTELIDAGFLSPFKVYAPSHPDLSQVRTVAGDYHEGQLSDVMRDQPLVADVVENWLRHGERRPTLCFAVDRPHAKVLEQSFTAAGVATAYIDKDTPGEERAAIGRRLHAGQIEVVVNIGTLTTGTDWDVRCVILARPTKSEMLFVQIIGRGLRMAEGKTECLVFDHSDTHQRLGFVTDIHHDNLDDGKGRQKAKPRAAPVPRECLNCHFLRPAKVGTCPACGFRAERQSEVVVEDGQLFEFGKGKAVERRRQREEQQRFFSMLIWIEQDRRYRTGWATVSFKDRFGQWPSNQLHHYPVKAEADVMAWVRSKMIRFAKKRNVA